MVKQLENKMEAREMWIYRRMGRMSKKQKQSNAVGLERLGIKRKLVTELKKKKKKPIDIFWSN